MALKWLISKLKNKIIIYNFTILFLIPLIFDRINSTRYCLYRAKFHFDNFKKKFSALSCVIIKE